jgi:hypothetical protein
MKLQSQRFQLVQQTTFKSAESNVKFIMGKHLFGKINRDTKLISSQS